MKIFVQTACGNTPVWKGFMFSELCHTVASGKLCFFMYSLRNLFLSLGVFFFFVCLFKPKSFLRFVCFDLEFFFSVLWHLFNKILESFSKSVFPPSFISMKNWSKTSFMLYKMVADGATVLKSPALVLTIQYLWRASRSVQRAEDCINNVTWYCGKHTWPARLPAAFLADRWVPAGTCTVSCQTTGGHQLQTGRKLLFQLSGSSPSAPASYGL